MNQESFVQLQLHQDAEKVWKEQHHEIEEEAASECHDDELWRHHDGLLEASDWL